MEELKVFLDTIGKKAVDFDKDLSGLSAEEQVEIIKYSCSDIPNEAELLERLIEAKKNKKALTIKFGVDPTGLNLHLGHAVPLVLLNRLQRMGHKIVFLVGNFTAKIGDPMVPNFNRRILKKDEIVENFKNYKKQAEHFLNFSNVELVYNASWLNNVKLPQLVSLLNQLDVLEHYQKEELNEAVVKASRLTYAELLYPVLVGLDSVRIKPDIEVAGADQIKNLNMARRVMELKKLKPQCNLTTGILPGIYGMNKMSKSLNNYIAIKENPSVMFELLANIPDKDIAVYYDLLTELTREQIIKLREIIENESINTGTLKNVLARSVIQRIYGKELMVKAALEYTQKLITSSNLTDIKIRSGSEITFCKTLSTVLEGYKTEDICRIAKTFGLAIHRADGGFVDYLTEIEQNIDNYPMDKFYIKISNHEIVKVIVK